MDIDKLNRIKDNLFSHSIAAIDDYNNFDWHKNKINEIDTDKVNSSQAIVIDVFGLLKLSPYKDFLINSIFNKNGIDWNIVFEYTDKTLLNEPKPTQIDIMISNNENVLLLESKFMEYNSGSCSQPKKQCNGNYEEQINPENNLQSKCSLTAKGIKYWDYISEIYKFNKNEIYCPCPFKSYQYQFMRNLCFGKSLSEKHKINVENYFIYYESEICPIFNKIVKYNYLEKLTKDLIDKNLLKSLSYNRLINTSKNLLQNKDKNEYNKWVELEKWLESKIITIKNKQDKNNRHFV